MRRHLTNHFTGEDRWQEAVALTWLMYLRYAQRGKILDDGILDPEVPSAKREAIELLERPPLRHHDGAADARDQKAE